MLEQSGIGKPANAATGWLGADGRHRSCRSPSGRGRHPPPVAQDLTTPNHLHGTIALAAMKAGKHVITHKPLANVLHEARLVIRTARETGAATHMFCAAGLESTADLTE